MRRSLFLSPILLRAFIIVLATLICYLPALRAGFIWDDPELLTENPLIHASNGLPRIWFGAESPDFFPLTLTSFWFEWRIWGAQAFGYHALNIVLHALSAVLLGRILVRLRVPGAFFAACLFAVHPVNVSSVAWIAERKNTLSMFFFFTALLCWLRDMEKNDRRFYWLALLAFLSALLSKTSVVMLPVILLGIAWWKNGAITRRDWLRVAPFFAASLLLGLVTIAFQHRNFTDDLPHDSIALQIARFGWIISFYAAKILWPFHLCLVYPRRNLDLQSPLTYAPTLLLVIFLTGLFFAQKKGGHPLLIGAGYFVVMLLPVCGLISMTFFNQAWIADWWQYAAMPGLLTLLAAGCATLFQHCKTLRAPLQFLFVALLLCLGSLTWQEAGNYESLEKNCRHALANNPLAWGIRNNLARELATTGRTGEALALYREGLRLEPDQKLTLDNLGKTLVTLGQGEEALPYCREVVKLQPNYAAGHNTLASALGSLKRCDEAAVEFRQAVRLQPARIDYRANLIRALLASDQPEAALLEMQITKRAAQLTGQTQQLGGLSAMLDSFQKVNNTAIRP